MDKILFEHIFILKLNSVKMHINLKIDEKAYFEDELKQIYKNFKLEDVNSLKKYAKERLAETDELLEKCKKLNKKIADEYTPTSFDAKTFYKLSSKKLACEEIINDCNDIADKLLDNDLQF